MGAAELPVSRRPHTMSAAAEKRLATVPAVKARVMVEGEDTAKVELYANDIAQLLERSLRS